MLDTFVLFEVCIFSIMQMIHALKITVSQSSDLGNGQIKDYLKIN